MTVLSRGQQKQRMPVSAITAGMRRKAKKPLLLPLRGALPLPPGAGEGEGEGAPAANNLAYMPKKGVHGLETCTLLGVPEQLLEAHRCTEPKGPPTLMLPAAGERKAQTLKAPLTTLASLLRVQLAQSG